ncbi:MAG: class I SAM-dependent methyltransferase [Verrucomicrobiales bacterium]
MTEKLPHIDPKSRGRIAPAWCSLALLCTLTPFCFAAKGEAPQPAHYKTGEQTWDGSGKYYMGREISQVVGHRAIAWLERPGREREEVPDKVVANMELEPDDTVLDIGAGSGYFTFRAARRVPEGKAIAEDINKKMLAFIKEKKTAEGVANLETHLGTIQDVKLPEASVNVAYLVDAYHEFSHPREMMESVLLALVPGGRLILLEYRKEDPSVDIKPLHKMTQRQAIAEMEAVGFEHLETRDFLPSQHFMIFGKPQSTAR